MMPVGSLTSPDATAVRPRGVVRSGLAVLVVALFFTNLDSYAYILSFGPPPVLYVMALCTTAALLSLMAPSRPLALLRSPLLLWAFCYFLMTTVWAVFMERRPELLQELYDRYRSIACLLAFAVVFDDPRARRVAVLSVAVAVAFASLVNIAETASLVTFTDSDSLRAAGRAAGLYFNANASGLAITLGLAVVIEGIPKALRIPLLLLGGFGVAATFSRGAMVCFALVLLWLVWRRALGTGYVALTMVGAVLLAGLAVSYLQAHDLLNENTLARLELTKDDSGRLGLALKAWSLFARSPWVGNGLGSTVVWDEPVRAHNMFATFAADHGVLGLLLFPALALALVKGHRGAACLALVLMAAGFFTHDALMDRYSLLLIALAAVPAHPTLEGDASPPYDSQAPEARRYKEPA